MKKRIDLENLIYFTVVAIPLYLVRFPFVNLLEIIILADLFFWILYKEYRKIDGRRFFEQYKGFVLAVGLIFFGLFLSTAVNGNYAAGLGIIKSWFVMPLIFVGIVAVSLPKEKYLNIFRALYLSAFLVALVAVIFLLVGKVTYDFRLEAIYDSPNYLAMYLAPAIIIGLVLFKEKKFYYGVSLAVILTAFYFTFSYGAWLAVAALLLAAALMNRKYNKKAVFGLVIFGIFLVSQLHAGKLESLVTFNSRSSLVSRIMIWRAAGKMIARHWFLGIGPGNFQAKYLAYQKYFPPYLEWAVPHPQSLYLTFWLYSGMLGFSGFLLLIVLSVKNFFQKKRNALWLISFGILLYFLIHGLADTTYFKNDLALVFWLTILGAI